MILILITLIKLVLFQEIFFNEVVVNDVRVPEDILSRFFANMHYIQVARIS